MGRVRLEMNNEHDATAQWELPFAICFELRGCRRTTRVQEA
jgi:hypothetical protein